MYYSLIVKSRSEIVFLKKMCFPLIKPPPPQDQMAIADEREMWQRWEPLHFKLVIMDRSSNYGRSCNIGKYNKIQILMI